MARCQTPRVTSSPDSPLRIPDYRRFWLSRFGATLATTGMVVILGYQFYDVARLQYGMSISEAALRLGGLGLVQFVPLFVLTPFSGVVADRFDRRWVAAIGMLLDVTIALALGLSTVLKIHSLELLYVLAALHGVGRVIISPSLSAIAPNVVPPTLIPRAIALNSIAWQSGSIIGPALYGFLYASNNALPYWISVGLILASTVSLLGIRSLPPVPVEARRTHPLRQMIDGFRFVGNERFLLGCITLDLFAVLLGGATALLPVYARDILQVGPEGLGTLRAAPAVGAALVALLLSFRPLETNVGVKMLVAVAVYGAATIGFGVSRWLPLSLLFLFVLGAADMVSVFVRGSLVQLNTPDDKRGRVSAISGVAISASNELGEMQSGLAAALLGATGAVVFGGVAAIFITVIWAVLFPELPRARTFAPQFRQKETPT